MKKPLVVVIHHNWGADVRYIGDVDVVSMTAGRDARDRVFKYGPSPCSAKALHHFVGPRKFWSDAEAFAPIDPEGRVRSQAAFSARHELSIHPNGNSPSAQARAVKAHKKGKAKSPVAAIRRVAKNGKSSPA